MPVRCIVAGCHGEGILLCDEHGELLSPQASRNLCLAFLAAKGVILPMPGMEDLESAYFEAITEAMRELRTKLPFVIARLKTGL